MTTTMATFGCTLCWKKGNTTPNAGRVFAVGVNEQTMDVTDVEELGGTPLGIVGACSRPSDAPPVATVPPDRCPRTVPSNAGRGSRTPGREGLDRFLRDGGIYWKQSKRIFMGEGLRAFSRGVLLYLRRVWIIQIPECIKHRAVVC